MMDKSFIVNFLGKSAGVFTDTKKKEMVNSKNSPDFINTLNSVVEKNTSVKSDITNQRKININTGNGIDRSIGSDSKAGKPEGDNKIKKFKDITGKDGQVTSEKEIGSNDKKSKYVKAKKETVSEEAIIEESLAGVLNISVEELRKILALLGLSSTDLTEEANTLQISQRISKLLGLSTEQEATLTKITDFIVKEAKSLMDDLQGIYDGKNLNKEGWIKLEDVKVQVVDLRQELPFGNTTELGDKLKESLDKLENRMENEPEAVFEAISSKIRELTTVKTNSVGQEDELEELPVTDTEDGIEPEITVSSKSDEKESTSNDVDTPKTEDSVKDYEMGNKVQNLKPNDFVNFMNTQQVGVNRTEEVSTVQSEVKVSGEEIIGQIVEKAKVVLTNEKSEMVIDLKPDHLGKLSLRVVTERGAVVAKFIAENEQVKAAIESNMDNLKESLSRQGFSIQDFSVSVRQDSKKGFDEDGNYSQNSRRERRGEKITAVGVSAMEENQQRLNPYMENTSTINLTA